MTTLTGGKEARFWEQAYFKLWDDKNRKWGIGSDKEFRGRYPWILEFVRYEQFPKEARCVRDALRQELLQQKGELNEVHPYDCKGDGEFNNFFNPDCVAAGL